MIKAMDHWRNGTDKVKLKYSDKNQSLCHYVYYKFHIDWPRIEPRPPH